MSNSEKLARGIGVVEEVCSVAQKTAPPQGKHEDQLRFYFLVDQGAGTGFVRRRVDAEVGETKAVPPSSANRNDLVLPQGLASNEVDRHIGHGGEQRVGEINLHLAPCISGLTWTATQGAHVSLVPGLYGFAFVLPPIAQPDVQTANCCDPNAAHPGTHRFKECGVKRTPATAGGP